MDNRKKNSIYSLILILAVATVWLVRNKIMNPDEVEKAPYVYVTGEAQGTTYNISYQDSSARNFKESIDSLLKQFDNSLSTYKEGSEILRFNENDSFQFDLPYFLPVLKASKEIYSASQGAFDPTVYPLMQAWNFKKEVPSIPDSAEINEILKYVGFNKITFDEKQVKKAVDRVSLDFNAIAQGYSIDVVFDFIIDKGIGNLMVELGGEVRAKGVNENGDAWAIGIDNPKPEASKAQRMAIIKIHNQAISTSGNYRNFFVHEGVKYGHTINPKTGFPVQRDIISATIVAPTCMEADAWSTAFMVTGLEDAKKILAEQTQLSAFFIYENEEGEMETYVTDNLASNILM
ncbi:FAD:protein FMN transferase [Marivirga sp. S37H4]|uniref:FAD:protein FMN transferase n=1 Tax=Marivirga aurantiaca TaxID=2802615 RepID=A0A934WXL8_9BACT|nr:FAD:protein FMN transferase [Marivirga aurantiaca]MBK6265023.1 FAD:protein FMN transferase [Marivirga aurantiaca]